MNFEVENLTNLAHCKKRSPFHQPGFTKVWTFCQGSASVPVRLNCAQSCGWSDGFFSLHLGVELVEFGVRRTKYDKVTLG